MVSKVARGATAGEILVAALGIKGGDRKNFVPVDWVSAVMCHIHGRPEFHGATYHVTSPNPPLILEMAAVMQEVVEELSPLGDPDSSWNLDGEWFAKTFRDQLGIYGAYWRDDPQFDMTNTFRAAPRLPCPKLDRKMMSQLARFAIDANFGRVRRVMHKPDFDVHSHMRRVLRSFGEMPEGGPSTACLGIQVDGPGGGQWELMVRGGRLVAIDDGVSPRSSAVFHVHSATFCSLVRGKLSVSQAVRSGHVWIEGNGLDRRQLEAVLQSTAAAGSVPVG
jgi:hypothetical protein